MTKRIRNYRTGDRAEDFGNFLLKAFCAVAPIPRQEDFGLADTVATLLRSEGQFWYAEDSFLVQFKSRTESSLTFEKPVFERWLAQDLSVFVGRVNLVENTMELFTTGTFLLDKCIINAEGLILWLEGRETEGLHQGVLHRNLTKPIVRFSVNETEDRNFTDRTYGIVKRWLELERWNRRYFRAGVAREIRWETNEIPAAGNVIHTWTPKHGREALSDIEPLVELLGLHAPRHPELWSRVQQMETVLRGPDCFGIGAGLLDFEQKSGNVFRLRSFINDHPCADLIILIQMLSFDPYCSKFTIHWAFRDQPGGLRTHEGTLEELRQKGFDIEVITKGDNAIVKVEFIRHICNEYVSYEIVEPVPQNLNLALGDYSPPFYLRRLPQQALEASNVDAKE
jgi:hypothetical protein